MLLCQPLYFQRHQCTVAFLAERCGEEDKPKCIYSYRLPDAKGVSLSVCKTMFLGTLGYTNNTTLMTPREDLASAPKEGGGSR